MSSFLKGTDKGDLESNETISSKLGLEEFVGWCIALLFPFAALGLMEVTKVPLLSALIYYGVFGIYLRIKMDGRLPYFKPQISKVRVETVLFIISGILCCYLYLSGASSLQPITWGLIINIFVFSILNGTFEHLVWVNIYDLAGK